MSWARYDDNFHEHPKVVAVTNVDPGAIALHVLANTWSHRHRQAGFVPSSVPARLVGKRRSQRWAALLVETKLWEAVDGGWRFHDWSVYGPSAELSAARSAAGSKGAAKRWQADGKRMANATPPPMANAWQDDGNASRPRAGYPEPVPNTPTTPNGSVGAPLPEFLESNGTLVGAYVEACREFGVTHDPRMLGRIGKEAKRLLDEVGFDRDDVVIALRELARRNEAPARLSYIAGDVQRARANIPTGRAKSVENPHDARIRAIREGRA